MDKQMDCPKCGPTILLGTYKWNGDIERGLHHVTCIACGIEGVGGKTPEEADRNWAAGKYTNFKNKTAEDSGD